MTRALLAVAAGASVSVALAALLRGLTPRPRSPRPPSRRPGALRRAGPAAVVAVLVLVATGWVLPSLVAGVLVLLRRRLFAGSSAASDRARLEGIAAWLEGLRDAVRGTNLTLERALLQVAEAPPPALAPELTAFRSRWRRQGSLRAALVHLGDDLAHPVADSAVAALVFTLDTAGPRAHRMLEQLAGTARAELAARQRVDRIRAQFERATKAMVLVAVALVVYLRLVGDLLTPYATAAGQVFLAVPLALWGASLLWLRSLARYEQPERYLIRTAEIVA